MANANIGKNAAESCVQVEIRIDQATEYVSTVINPRAQDGHPDLTSGAHSLPIGSQSTMRQASPSPAELGIRRHADVPGGHVGSPTKLASLLTNIERDSFAVAASVKAMLDSIQSVVSQSMECTQEHLECYDNITRIHYNSVHNAVEQTTGLIETIGRLNEELQSVEPMAQELKGLKRLLEALEVQANKIL